MKVAVQTGWSYETPTKRYAIAAGRRSTDSRIYPALILCALAVYWFIALPAWLLIPGIPVLGHGVYRLFRPIGEKWCVELASDSLTIQFLGRNTFAYRDLISADRRIPQGLMRPLVSFSIVWGRLWGGGSRTDPDSLVKLRLKRWTWCRLGYLKIPRRVLQIPMESPEEFAADVNARTALAAQSP